MGYEIDRRTVLKGIAAGAVTLTYAGSVTASGQTRYLVGAKGQGIENQLERAGFTVQRTLADGRVHLVLGESGRRDALRDVRGVQHAERDFRCKLERPERMEAADTETEPEFPLQWDKQVTDVSSAHDMATGAGRTIAIIDSGVDHDHTDLPNVVAGEGRLFREGVTDAGATGEVQLPATTDPVYDQDCIEVGLAGGTVTETRAFADDVLDHGTHVAGIAAGARNDFGIVGTAPDADVIPLRVFYWIEEEVDTDGNGEPDTMVANLVATFGGILAAIDHAASLGVDAMNLSIGTAPLPPQYNATAIRGISELVIQNAIRRGSLVVVSAGNSNANLQQGGYFTWPNSMAGAMSISATGPNDKRVFYSNFGTNEISVGAPGGGFETLLKTLAAPEYWEILAQVRDDIVDPDGNDIDDAWEVPVTVDPDEDVCGDEFSELVEVPVETNRPFPTNLVISSVPPEFWDGAEHAWFAGTSMAAPQVAGTAALIREVAPDSTARQVEKAIEQGAEAIEGESRAEFGFGRLNCLNALDAPAIE